MDIDGKEILKMEINPEMGIDYDSTGMRCCRTPMIVTTDFLKNNTIFVNLYHKKKRCQYHMLIDYFMKTVVDKGVCNFDPELKSSE